MDEDGSKDQSSSEISNEINIVMIGDPATGKTSLIQSYVHDTFSIDYAPSVFDTFRCEVEIKHP